MGVVDVVYWDKDTPVASKSGVRVPLRAVHTEAELLLSESRTRELIHALQYALGDVEKLNPHPGYDHEPSFCAACGY